MKRQLCIETLPMSTFFTVMIQKLQYLQYYRCLLKPPTFCSLHHPPCAQRGHVSCAIIASVQWTTHHPDIYFFASGGPTGSMVQKVSKTITYPGSGYLPAVYFCLGLSVIPCQNLRAEIKRLQWLLWWYSGTNSASSKKWEHIKRKWDMLSVGGVCYYCLGNYRKLSPKVMV